MDNLKDALARFAEIFGPGTDTGDVGESLKALLKGTPEEQAAAHGIAQNVAEALEKAKVGLASQEDVLFTLEEARKGLLALGEAKVIRIEKKAADVLIDSAMLFLTRI